jgi:hypothetical protein
MNILLKTFRYLQRPVSKDYEKEKRAVNFIHKLIDKNPKKGVETRKFVEDSIISQLESIKFKERRVNVYCRKGLVSKFGLIKLYTEDGGIAGSFSYFMVGDRDLNANYLRMQAAIRGEEVPAFDPYSSLRYDYWKSKDRRNKC